MGSNPTLSASAFIGEKVPVLPDSCQKTLESPAVNPETMTKAGKQRKTLKLSVRATRLGIRVRKVPNRSRGEVYGHSWLVVVPAKVTGGQRLRRQYQATESREAVDFAEGEANKAKEQGQTAFFLRPEQVTDARAAFARLEGLGLSLAEAAEYAAKHLRPVGGDKTLSEVRNMILDRKKKKGLRPASLHALGIYMSKLVNQFGPATLVKSVSNSDLSAWVDSFSTTEVSPRFIKNVVAYTRQFFRFAEEEKFIGHNPTVNLGKDAPMTDEREIVILNIDQTKALLRTAMTKEHRPLLPAVVLGLFCGGIRTEELKRLNWNNLNLTERKVTLPPKVTKTRGKRVCDIPPAALEFLLLHENRKGPITPKRFEFDVTTLHQDAGFKNWKRDFANAKRHSFGTYASKLHDWNWVVDQMGNSVSMLLQHYRDASVSKKDAEAYFKISPNNIDAVAEVVPIEKEA